jgi:hypothetical protein
MNIQNSSSYMFKRLEMNGTLGISGLGILLVALSIVFFAVLIGMNTINSVNVPQEPVIDGFVDSSDIEVQIRAVLDEMDSKELCPLFAVIRTNMLKNAKAGQDISDQEAAKRVEADLAVKIPGGALPCPLLNYPKAGSSDLDWLDFLQKVPSDFGARVVLMAVFAEGFLTTTEQTMKLALSGNGTPPVAENFEICSPDVADSRRAEKQNKGTSCTLPEELNPAQIKEAVTKLLKDLVGNKTTILKSKKIDPLLDIKPLIAQAKKSAEYLSKKAKQAESGELEMEGSIKMQPKA